MHARREAHKRRRSKTEGFREQRGAVQVVEEFMSIADGQVVLQREDGGAAVGVDPQASVSRIGSRAYPPALADLAVQLRFELAQVRLDLLIETCLA